MHSLWYNSRRSPSYTCFLGMLASTGGTMQTSYQDKSVIERILSTCKTIAVVGLSSQPDKAGYYVPAYLQTQGYRIIPVNPTLEQALGEKSYPDLLALPQPVDLVLIFRRSEAVPPFVDQAIQVGAKAVWMQLGIVNESAAQKAEAAGLDVVMDACMMVEHRRRS
jgi:uncharacterized protein